MNGNLNYWKKIMDESKQDYLQKVLNSNRMVHIGDLVEKYKDKRRGVKEALEEKYGCDIYNPINSGSFAKSTAINSKFDLDLAVPFKKSSFSTLEKMFDDIYEFLLDKHQSEATVRKQKVSIGLEFYADPDGDVVSLDIVPGRELNQDQYNDDYKINLYVNSRYGLIEEKSHLLTNINAQIEHIKAKAPEREIIRLLKVWKTSNSEPYKSFLLELLTIKAFQKESISGSLWEKLKSVLNYIEDNVTKDNFTLKDPGNSGNNIIETLEPHERETLSNSMKLIIENIDSNENNIKIYFPTNKEYEEAGLEQKGYGIKKATLISVPPKTRFGH